MAIFPNVLSLVQCADANLNTLFQNQPDMAYQLINLFFETAQPKITGDEVVHKFKEFFQQNNIPMMDADLSHLLTELKDIKDASHMQKQVTPDFDILPEPLDKAVVKNNQASQTQYQSNLPAPVVGKTVINQNNGMKSKDKKNTLDKSQSLRPYDPKGILVSGELHPEFSKRIETLLKQARKQGLSVFIFDGFRSIERQNKLFNSGKNVTNARGGNSLHNYGLAADIVFYDKKGNPSWAEYHDWKALGALGKKLDLIWGSDFKRISDQSHFEYHPDTKLKEIKEIFREDGLKGVWDKISLKAGLNI